VFEDSFVDWSRLTTQQRETIQKIAAVLAARDERRIGRVFRYARFFTDEDERVQRLGLLRTADLRPVCRRFAPRRFSRFDAPIVIAAPDLRGK